MNPALHGIITPYSDFNYTFDVPKTTKAQANDGFLLSKESNTVHGTSGLNKLNQRKHRSSRYYSYRIYLGKVIFKTPS
jgi:hypothetical protein